MKKRLLTNLITFLLLPVLISSSLLMLTGCNNYEDTDENSITQSRNVKLNKVINACDMSKSDLPAGKTCKSWKDEKGNCYYIIYLGMIEMAEIYNIESFYYSNDFEELNLTEENITVNTVTQSYRNTITRTTDWSTTAYIENEIEVGAEVKKGIFSAGVKDSFTTGIEQQFGITYTDESESIYTQVITTTKRTLTEKRINFKKACTKGNYYRYSVCGDVNCFLNLYVPADGSDATYQVCSEFDPNKTFTILLESESHNGFFLNENFLLEKINKSDLATPTEVINSHPDIIKSETKYDTTNIGYNLGIFSSDLPFSIYDIYNKAISKGEYNKIEVRVTLKSEYSGMGLIPRDIEGFISYSHDKSNNFAYRKWCSNDSHIEISGVTDLKYFSTEKKIYLLFYIPTYAYGGQFKISNVEMTVRIFVG